MDAVPIHKSRRISLLTAKPEGPQPGPEPDRAVRRVERISDEELFARYLQGDDAAFMELFHRHTSRLFAYCLKILGNREKAHDVLQDVWEQMARFRLHGKEGPKSVAGFLIRSVRNRALNEKNRRRPELSLEEISEEQHPKTAEGMENSREVVLAALDRLPEEQRELLILHIYAGYSYQEIAQSRGLEIGAIRTRAWRARMELGRIVVALMKIADEEK